MLPHRTTIRKTRRQMIFRQMMNRSNKQTFSMLNIQLGQDEDVATARGRLGDAASVESLVFSRGPASFIAPQDGPAKVYQSEIEALERKLYRMAGLPWEGDAAGAESADRRRDGDERVPSLLVDDAQRASGAAEDKGELADLA